jgi:hypothetical protein
MDLQLFLDSPAGLALKGALVAAFADFATGAFAALRDGTFQLDALAAFVRKHLLGRVFPLGTLLAVGYSVGGDSSAILLSFAIAGLTAYAAETISSITGNLNPPKSSDIKAETQAEVLNPVPTE